MLALVTHAHELDPQTFHGEAGQLAHAGEGFGVELTREIADLAAGKAAGVRVRVGPAVVAGGPVAVGELGGEATAHQGFEGLVDGGERNIGNDAADRREHIVGRGMFVGLTEEPIDCSALLGKALAAGLERRSEQAVRVVPVLWMNVHCLAGSCRRE